MFMRSTKSVFGAFALLFFLFAGTSAQALSSTAIIDTTFCELVERPEKYDGKIVRVKAIYRSSFELSEVYCPECYDSRKRVWAEFTEMSDRCLKSKETKRLKKGSTLLVVFVGEFQAAESNYGHSNAYRFQLDVKCIGSSKILSKSKPLLPSELKEFGLNEVCK